MTKKLTPSMHSHKRAKASQTAYRRSTTIKDLATDIINLFLSP